MTPRLKKIKYIPPDERVYIATRRAPLEVHTPGAGGAIITLHQDEAEAEREVCWQRRLYGREAVIVRAE